jgi:hypothetical protein
MYESAVISTGCWLDGQDRIPDRDQTGPGAHSTSYPLINEADKTAAVKLTTHFYLAARSRRMELYIHLITF